MKGALTIEQEKAARLIATGHSISDNEVAKEVKITIAKLRDWKKDPQFKLAVLRIFDSKIDSDMSYRYKKTDKLLNKVYKEITSRMRSKDSLENWSLKDLLRTMILLNNELRIDSRFDKAFLNNSTSESRDEGGDEYMTPLQAASLKYSGERKSKLGNKKVVSIR